jgi:hypothetical protein
VVSMEAAQIEQYLMLPRPHTIELRGHGLTGRRLLFSLFQLLL